MQVIEIEDFDPAWIHSGEVLNILVGACSQEQVERMFGPTTEIDLFIEVPRSMSWPGLLVALECYASKILVMKSFCKPRKLSPEIVPGWHQETIWAGSKSLYRFDICLFKPAKTYKEEGPL